jgi:hypothetical protein
MAYRAVAEDEGMLPESNFPTSGSYSFNELRANTKKVIGKILSSCQCPIRSWEVEYDKPFHCDDVEPWECTFTYRMDSLHWHRGHLTNTPPPIWLEGNVTVSAMKPTELFDRVAEKVDELMAYEKQLNEALFLAEQVAKVKTTETV